MTTPNEQIGPIKPIKPIKPNRRRRLGLLLAGVLLLPVLLAAMALGLYWTLKQPSGSAWLLQRVPGLQIEAGEGTVLGDYSARQMLYTLPAGAGRIRLRGVQWQGLGLAWSSAPALWGQLNLARLRIDQIQLELTPSTEPSRAPTSLALPIGIRVAVLEIGRIDAAALGTKPLLGLIGSADLSGNQGDQHRLRVDALQWDKLRLSGAATLATRGAMTVAATLAAQPAEPSEKIPDWRGTLSAAGPLADLQVKAALSAAGQSLQVQAQIQAFAAWPLAAFKAQADKLDLAALISGMPRTALSGAAALQAKGWREPALLDIQLGNAAAGPWNKQQLPVQHLSLLLRARPDQPQNLQLEQLDALLGSPTLPGGRLTGEGRLAPDGGWAFDGKLAGLRPAALDSRLAALRLDGSLKLAGMPQAPLTLEARLVGSGQTLSPVQIGLQASLDGTQLTVREARLTSGKSALTARGEASQTVAGWRASGEATLQNFDPRLLWAGEAGSTWQRGPHSLNASLTAQLQQDRAASWPTGTARLALLDSRLAGTPLTGQLDYLLAAGSAEASLQAQLDVAGNRLQAQARLPALAADAGKNTAQLDLQAPKLAALNPLLGLLQAGLQASGAAEGKASVELQRRANLWQIRSDGQLRLQSAQLQSGTFSTSLAKGQLRWSGGSALDAPLAATAVLERLVVGQQLASTVNAELQGTWAQHRLSVALKGTTSAEVVGEAALTLEGRLNASPLQAWQDLNPLNWQARIDRLLLRPANRALPAWLDAQGLDLQVQGNAATGISAASLAPGRAELAGTQVRWSNLQWQAARHSAERADLRAEIELEPLAAAPLLARWQPDFGWGGPLVVGGKLSVRTRPSLDVSLVLERSAGDLSVTDERGVQPLGLTDLRLALNVQDGKWQFTQALAGTNLGSLGGAITVHAERNALWPAPGARLEGVLQANVANLGTWGGWVPAGWRLAGQVTAGLQLAGTFGVPQLVGQASGTGIAVRNPLQGVDVTEGAFALSLNGATATLNSLRARGGKGSVSAEGEAQLGAQPTARLQLKAEQFVLLNRVDRRLQVSGEASVKLAAADLQIDGKFGIDEGLFDFSRGDAPSLDDDVYVMRPQTLPSEPGRAAANASTRKTRIQLALSLGQDLKLRGRGLDSRLRGDLKLTQTDGTLALTGTVSTFGGTYEAYGQKLEIERGQISFVGPFDNPRLDVQAVRSSNDDVRVGVTVGGSALNPRVRLFSEPEMSDTDKLSWLVLGRAPDGLGRADTALLQRAALALLSGEGESTSGKLIKNLGLDELSVQQGEDDTRGTVVRLGKQLSRRWFVAYERGLNATTGSWQLIYRIAQRFTLRAQSGADNALELIWQWKWQ